MSFSYADAVSGSLKWKQKQISVTSQKTKAKKHGSGSIAGGNEKQKVDGKVKDKKKGKAKFGPNSSVPESVPEACNCCCHKYPKIDQSTQTHEDWKEERKSQVQVSGWKMKGEKPSLVDTDDPVADVKHFKIDKRKGQGFFCLSSFCFDSDLMIWVRSSLQEQLSVEGCYRALFPTWWVLALFMKLQPRANYGTGLGAQISSFLSTLCLQTWKNKRLRLMSNHSASRNVVILRNETQILTPTHRKRKHQMSHSMRMDIECQNRMPRVALELP